MIKRIKDKLALALFSLVNAREKQFPLDEADTAYEVIDYLEDHGLFQDMPTEELEELVDGLQEVANIIPERQERGNCDYQWHQTAAGIRGPMCPACGEVGGYGFEPMAKEVLRWGKIDVERLIGVERSSKNDYELHLQGPISSDDTNNLRVYLNQKTKTEIRWTVTVS